MAEFVECLEKLGSSPSVGVFGSARIRADHPDYVLAVDVAKRLSNSGFSVVSGGGPGIIEAVDKGACAGRFSFFSSAAHSGAA